ncbi:MAG: isoprenylcysteine carboxylmethyltransferase family protein [Alkalispirochaeta sp.]
MTAERIILIVVYLLFGAEWLFLSVPSTVSFDPKESRKNLRFWARGGVLLVILIGFFAPLVWSVYPKAGEALLLLDLPKGLRVMGTVPVALGEVVVLLACKRLRDSSEELVTGGVFRLTRNPIVVSIYLRWVGVLLVLPSAVSLISLLVCVAYLHGRILREETNLRRWYGGKYEDYRRKVPRYLPFVSRSRESVL